MTYTYELEQLPDDYVITDSDGNTIYDFGNEDALGFKATTTDGGPECVVTVPVPEEVARHWSLDGIRNEVDAIVQEAFTRSYAQHDAVCTSAHSL